MREGQPTPIELAAEFSQLCALITQTPANPMEEQMVGDSDLSIRVFDPMGPARGVPGEMAETIEQRAAKLLEQAHGTKPYKDHLLEMIGQFCASGMMRILGSDFIVELSGVNLEKNRAGIFDPADVKRAELFALKITANTDAFLPRFIDKKERELAIWVPAYEREYGDTPSLEIED